MIEKPSKFSTFVHFLVRPTSSAPTPYYSLSLCGIGSTSNLILILRGSAAPVHNFRKMEPADGRRCGGWLVLHGSNGYQLVCISGSTYVERPSFLGLVGSTWVERVSAYVGNPIYMCRTAVVGGAC